jgi:hypothetical protein
VEEEQPADDFAINADGEVFGDNANNFGRLPGQEATTGHCAIRSHIT